MKTVFFNPKEKETAWILIDAKQKVLGRVASKAARILLGKEKPNYSPSQPMGDRVIIINASEINLTGKKKDTKEYFSHSTYAGGGRTLSFRQLQAKDSALPVVQAVKGMLPKNSLGREIIKRLYVYGESSHPHSAQKPEAVSI